MQIHIICHLFLIDKYNVTTFFSIKYYKQKILA